ncbi:MAG: hypothetical protein IPH74_09145 [Bacteroidetes bacterium]|nr:hypothetical protein [Bacteroidota bacterium]
MVTGKCEGDNFKATNILMKCPSKYVQDEMKTATL